MFRVLPERITSVDEATFRRVPYVRRVVDQVNAAQKLIDTPEEYERVAGACNGDIKNRIR